MNLKDRLERVTKRMVPPEINSTQVEEDAATVMKRLSRYAKNFEDADVNLTADDRRTAGMSVAQDLAWCMRFADAGCP